MDNAKLKTLISEKNERIERETLRSAESLIDAIATRQRQIKTAESDIADLRKQLSELSIESLDPTALLGE